MKANDQRICEKSASVADDDESFGNLVIQPKRRRPIDLQSEATLSYGCPVGDQGKNMVEDLFGNDFASINSFFVDLV